VLARRQSITPDFGTQIQPSVEDAGACREIDGVLRDFCSPTPARAVKQDNVEIRRVLDHGRRMI